MTKHQYFKNIFRLALVFLLLSGFQDIGNQEADKQTDEVIVYKIDIKENIAPPVWRTTKKSIEEALDIGADYGWLIGDHPSGFSYQGEPETITLKINRSFTV